MYIYIYSSYLNHKFDCFLLMCQFSVFSNSKTLSLLSNFQYAFQDSAMFVPHLRRNYLNLLSRPVTLSSAVRRQVGGAFCRLHLACKTTPDDAVCRFRRKCRTPLPLDPAKHIANAHAHVCFVKIPCTLKFNFSLTFLMTVKAQSPIKIAARNDN